MYRLGILSLSCSQLQYSQTICWHHRRMIPPLGREHLHGKTQYIPGKQVLVSAWMWKTKYTPMSQCALCQIYAESWFNNTQFAPNQLWIAPGTWHCYYAFICSVIVRPTGIRLLKTWYVSFFWTWNDIALELLDSRYFVQSCVPNIPYNENKCNAIRF